MDNIWEAEAVIPLNELVIPMNAHPIEVKLLTNPDVSKSILLYGPPGTGKTATCLSIAGHRCGVSTIQELLDCGVTILDCKERDVRDSVSSDSLMRKSNMSSLVGAGANIIIIDEVDELTPNQQKELTGFINAKNRQKSPTIILATTNVMITNNTERKRISEALLSRFSGRWYCPEHQTKNLLNLIHRKMKSAGMNPMNDDELIEYIEVKTGAGIHSIRDIRHLTNTLIQIHQYAQ